MKWTEVIQQATKTTHLDSQHGRQGLALAGALAIPLLVGVLSGIATSRSIPTWYARLRKPWWNPPNWVFAPVWTVLYLLMGIASWLVWQRGQAVQRLGHGRSGLVRGALALYAVQLLLNGAWSLIFFGARRVDLALGELVILWGMVLATAVRFGQIRPLAGWLLLPYQLWVSFAGILNGAIWRLNR
jgi:translocator protein